LGPILSEIDATFKKNVVFPSEYLEGTRLGAARKPPCRGELRKEKAACSDDLRMLPVERKFKGGCEARSYTQGKE
jgi:hypothetical protein